MLPQPRRRWAFFPRSVISDHENPSAHLYRAMAREVVSLDDEARFYEERANPWLRNMLMQQGAAALRTFQDRHPEVSYITYEPRKGHQLAEWLSLALATVDIVVVDSAAPETIVRWIGELTRPRLHTFLMDPDGRIARAEQQADYVAWYRGLCTNDAHGSVPEIQEDQFLITFGPALPEPGHNGSATAHIDATAAEIVGKLVSAVDETLSGRPGDSSSSNGSQEPV